MTLVCAFAPVELVVDRVVESIAVVESSDLRVVDVPLAVLPLDVREGDRLAVCLVALPPSPAREAQFRVKDERSFAQNPPRSSRVH